MISVYTVNYNTRLDWLKECVKAVSRQSFKKFEYIFIDYGSDNIQDLYYELMELCSEIDFRFLKIDKAMGYNFIDAIRYALMQSNYKYILRADGDDIMHPDCLKTLIKHSYENHVVYGDYYIINENNEYMENNSHKTFLPAHALIDRSVLEKTKFYDGQSMRDGTSIEQTLKECSEFWVKEISDKLFFYRKHSNSLTSDHKLVKSIDERITK